MLDARQQNVPGFQDRIVNTRLVTRDKIKDGDEIKSSDSVYLFAKLAAIFRSILMEMMRLYFLGARQVTVDVTAASFDLGSRVEGRSKLSSLLMVLYGNLGLLTL